jgi:hypothetical protein
MLLTANTSGQEAVVLCPPRPATTTVAGSQAPPDFNRVSVDTLARSVILVSALVGTPERVRFTREGACLIPVEPDGRYAPFASLAEVFKHVDEINTWLTQAAGHRGVPPHPPRWLADLPEAGPHLLGTIRSRIAIARKVQITLLDLNGHTASIAVPPRGTLALPRDNLPETKAARLAARKQFALAVDLTGETVHVPLDPDRDVPALGEELQVDLNKLRRESRLRAAHVNVRNGARIP